ncbi:MAG: hypothetical protein K0Q74_83 [Gammaproteobacteria bacterium]|jgi:hypothetical protein|nr:hypothetical protein [Gammaproteobacteria bacterium]
MPITSGILKLEKIGPDPGHLMVLWHEAKEIYLQKMHPHTTQFLNNLIAE